MVGKKLGGGKFGLAKLAPQGRAAAPYDTATKAEDQLTNPGTTLGTVAHAGLWTA